MKKEVSLVSAALSFGISLAVLCGSSTAAEMSAKTVDKDKEARRAANRQIMLEKTGGFVERPSSSKVAIVNCQKKISNEEIVARALEIKRAIRVNIEVMNGTWSMNTSLPQGAKAALYIVEDSALPMSLAAPEAHWGLLNVSGIDSGSRFFKAMVRASVLAFGAGATQSKLSVMLPVSCPEDLDSIQAEGVTFDVLHGIVSNLQRLGVSQIQQTTYRKACMEGWAAAPTNDYQKVIWEEVHSKPTDPMKIKFDPKKGE